MPSRRVRYLNPPIVEVICGVWFPPLSGLDPLAMGAYWASRREAYPARQVHPVIDPEPGFRIHRGVAPLRAWLMSKDKSAVIQLQHDRFYLNWRRVADGEYPSFSNENAGLRDRSIDEFDHFSAFCADYLGRRPTPMRVEVGKVDHVPWKGVSDLERLMPAFKTLGTLAKSNEPQTMFALSETRGSTDVRIQVAIPVVADEDAEQQVLRLETNVLSSVTAGATTIKDSLNEANQVVNDVFYEWFDEIESKQRFGVKS